MKEDRRMDGEGVLEEIIIRWNDVRMEKEEDEGESGMLRNRVVRPSLMGRVLVVA